jgi:hypothetical protein
MLASDIKHSCAASSVETPGRRGSDRRRADPPPSLPFEFKLGFDESRLNPKSHFAVLSYGLAVEEIGEGHLEVVCGIFGVRR